MNEKKGVFRKIKTWVSRSNSTPIDVSAEKVYGNIAEIAFQDLIKRNIPNCKAKYNLIVDSDKGRCEIDCLLWYSGKLFIVEIKHWNGIVEETSNGFVETKQDRYTDEIHEKYLDSPFAQVRRQVNAIKRYTNSNPYINTIVFFCDPIEINIESDDVWFADVEELMHYIVNDGKETDECEIKKCFDGVVSADCLYSYEGENNEAYGLKCIIDEDSLLWFSDEGRVIRKAMMNRIKIKHHLSYDEVWVLLKSGETLHTTFENKIIHVNEPDHNASYSLAKIAAITIGE